MLTRDNFPTTSSASFPCLCPTENRMSHTSYVQCPKTPHTSTPVFQGDLLRPDRTHTHLSTVAPGHFLPPTTKALHLLKLPIILCMHHLSTSLVSSGPREELAPSYWFPLPAAPPPHESTATSLHHLTADSVAGNWKGSLTASSSYNQRPSAGAWTDQS